jgi:diguanylate cyclase (GGDEF)-like protein
VNADTDQFDESPQRLIAGIVLRTGPEGLIHHHAINWWSLQSSRAEPRVLAVVYILSTTVIPVNWWGRMKVDRRDYIEKLILDENKTAIIFYLAGASAGIALLPTGHYSHHTLWIVLALTGCSLLGALLRFEFGDRLSPVGLQVVFVAGWSLITVAAAVGPSVHVNFAVLYIWVAVYAALYYPAVLVVVHTAAASLAYLIVLLSSHVSAGEVVASWTSVFGTAFVLSAVVFGLVATLRRNGREDRLTGLSNRRTWDERIDSELERARRGGTHLSVVSIDIDNFKLINDREGHQAGDRLLRQVADGWRGMTRVGGDLVARLGGDEFGLLAPGSDVEEIVNVVQRLRDALPDGVSCSMGVATWDHVETSADLFRRADEAMFQLKREMKKI